MSFLYTGETGTPLRDIIQSLGNKSYACIYERCKWIDRYGIEQDDFFGACSYDAVDKKLSPLDGDTYSLNDLFEEWEETEEGNLVVWERGVLKD